MREFSIYLLEKLYKMEKKDMEKTMSKDFDYSKKEFENETIYFLKKKEVEE